MLLQLKHLDMATEEKNVKRYRNLTGGQVISEELGLELKDTTMDQLGRAKSVKVQKENTVIVDGWETRMQSQIVLPDQDRSKRQHLISIKKNYRKDLLNLQAV